jgi:hypothetical protein
MARQRQAAKYIGSEVVDKVKELEKYKGLHISMLGMY